MILIPALRGRRGAISTLYGAFAVVLVSAVVVGVILAAPAPRAFPDAREGAMADQFLDAVLASTVEGEGTTIGRAVSIVCLRAPCSASEITREELRANLSALATPLAQALDRHYELVLSNATGSLVSVGNLPKAESATASRAEFYHGQSATYLTLTLLLGAD